MLSDHDEALARAAFAPVRDIEPDEDLVARALARAGRRKKAPPRFAVAPARSRLAPQALAALVLLGATLYSVPVTRAAIQGAGESVGGVFSGWLGGESAEAPGKSLGSGEGAPENLYQDLSVKEPRVIAEAGGYRLYSYIGSDGGLNFEFGRGDNGSFGLGYENVAQLGDSSLHVLGPWPMPPGHRGHVPLFGIVARSVSSVELTYESGPPLRVSGVEGGFILLAEPSRGPVDVIALDAGGEEIGREPIDYPLVGEGKAPPPRP
jgi:hypothetical protein